MDIPENLIDLERAAEAEHAAMAGLVGPEYEEQWRRWRKAAEKVQAAIAKHAEDTSQLRYELEMAVKKAVRHAEPEA